MSDAMDFFIFAGGILYLLALSGVLAYCAHCAWIALKEQRSDKPGVGE